MLHRITLVLTLAPFIPYILGICDRGLWGQKIKSPVFASVVSWVIWFVLDLVIVGGMFAKGTVSYLMIGLTVGAGAVLITLVVTKARVDWNGWDTVSAYGVCIALGGWYLIQSADVAIIASAATIGLGALPAIRDAFDRPSRQAACSWALWGVASMCGLAESAFAMEAPNPFAGENLQATIFMATSVLLCLFNLISADEG